MNARCKNVDPACDRHGQPGDGKTYRPPNSWIGYMEDLLKLDEPVAFGSARLKVCILPPPDGAEVDAEIRYMLSLKQTVRPLVLEKICEEHGSFFPSFRKVLGIGKTLHWVERLMDHVGETARYWIAHEKDKHNRPRPVQLEPTLEPPFCPGHPAYPSSHSGESLAVALALCDALGSMATDARLLGAELIGVSRRVGFHREVAGVHYPSDTTAGAMVANQLIEALRSNEEYKETVKQAHEQLEEALGSLLTRRSGD